MNKRIQDLRELINGKLAELEAGRVQENHVDGILEEISMLKDELDLIMSDIEASIEG